MKLIVDIGKFELTLILLDNTFTIKKIEVITLQDMEDILTPVGKRSLVNKIVDRVKATYDSFNFKELICVIPTQDMLLKSDKPYTTDSVIEELERMGIYIDDDVTATIGKPSVYKGVFTVPVSIYDSFLDNIYEDLNPLGFDIRFISPISRLMKRVANLEGRVAIADSSFSKTRVLIADNGMPIEYAEFNMCGKDLISILSETTKSIKDALVLLHDKSKNDLPQITRYLAEEIIPINKYLREKNVEAFIPMGGLSALNLEDYIKVKVADIDHLKLPQKIEKLRNKILLSLSCDSEYDLIDDRNIVLLEEIYNKYKDTIDQKPTSKKGIMKKDNKRSKTETSSSDDIESAGTDDESSKKSSGFFKGSKNKDKPIKSKEKKQQKPRKTREETEEKQQKQGIFKIIFVLLVLVVLAGSYFGFNYYLDMRANEQNINQAVEVQSKEMPTEALSQFADKLAIKIANENGLTPDLIGIQSSYDTVNRTVEIGYTVPNTESDKVFEYLTNLTMSITDTSQVISDIEPIKILSINVYNPAQIDDKTNKITIMLAVD